MLWLLLWVVTRPRARRFDHAQKQYDDQESMRGLQSQSLVRPEHGRADGYQELRPESWGHIKLNQDELSGRRTDMSTVSWLAWYLHVGWLTCG